MGWFTDAGAPIVRVFGIALRLTPSGRYVLGLVFLMGVVFIWVGVSELMQVRACASLPASDLLMVRAFSMSFCTTSMKNRLR